MSNDTDTLKDTGTVEQNANAILSILDRAQKHGKGVYIPEHLLNCIIRYCADAKASAQAQGAR